MRISLSLLLVAVTATCLPGQNAPPRLLDDLRVSEAPGYLHSDFVELGGWHYIAGSPARLFRTAGTAASTGPFFDLGSGIFQEALTAVRGRLFFVAASSVDRELWTSDGTVGGTRSLPTLAGRWEASRMLDFGGRLAFSLSPEGTANSELWVSDGTPTGTYRLHGDAANPLPSGVTPLASAPAASGSGERLWFTTFSQLPGWPGVSELWSSDGTAAGTRRESYLLGEALFGLQVLGPGTMVAMGYSGSNPFLPARLLRIDEGAGITELPTSASLSVFSPFTVAAGGRAFFAADGTAAAVVTDGTPAGTRSITVQGAPKQGRSTIVGAVGGRVVLAYPSAASTRLARIAAGSNVAIDIGTAPIGVERAVDRSWLGDKLFYVDSSNPASNPFGALYCVDTGPGPTGGTATLLADRVDGSLTTVAGRVLFGRFRQSGSDEIWSSDGTSAGTQLFYRVPRTPRSEGSWPRLFRRLGKRTVFHAGDDSAAYPNLWITDGTPGNTRRIANRYRTAGLVRPEASVEVGDEVWVVERGGVSVDHQRVFAVDGQVGRIRYLIDLQPTGSGGRPDLREPVAHGRGVLLHGTDGTRTGVFRLDADGTFVQVYATSRPIETLRSFGEWAGFVLAPGGGQPRQVFVTDGTPARTALVGAAGSTAGGLTKAVGFADALWLATADGVFVATQQGVSRFAAWPAGGLRLYPSASGSRLFAVGADRVLVTDGTVAGTASLLQGAAGIPYDDPRRVAAFGESLLFLSETELWVSDGSAQGTRRIGRLGSGDIELVIAGVDRAWVAVASSNQASRGLWRTDGSVAGTQRVFDVPIAASAARLTHLAGDAVLLAVDDPVYGVEPYVFDPGAVQRALGVAYSGGGFVTPGLSLDADPRPGSRARLTARHCAATVGWLLIGLPATAVAMVPGSRLHLQVDPVGSLVLGGFTLDGSGRAAIELRVPNSPAVLDFDFAVQALFAGGGGPLDLDASAGLQVHIGR